MRNFCTRRPRAICRTLLCALMGVALCTGCYKGDGTESRAGRSAYEQLTSQADNASQVTPQTTAPRTPGNPSQTTPLTVDSKAAADTPFSFDAAKVQEPKQGIVLVLIYERTVNGAAQTVNYYDKNGYAYRYRAPLDTRGDWFAELQADYPTAQPVNQMSKTEQQTLWYLAEEMDAFAALPTETVEAPMPPLGTYTLYGITEDGAQVPLIGYAKTVSYRKDNRLTAFANWFRYFYHGEYRYPTDVS